MNLLPADFRVELVVEGPPRTLKNSKVPRPIRPKRGGRPGAFSCPCCKQRIHITLPLAKPAAEWRKAAIPQLKKAWPYDSPLPKWVRVNLCIISYLPTRRLPDASNLYEGPQDAMTEAGIWEDDVVVASHDGSRRRYDPKRPRTVIIITPAEPDLEDEGRQPDLFEAECQS